MVLSIFVTTTISLGALSLLLDLMYSKFGNGVFIYIYPSMNENGLVDNPDEHVQVGDL